MKATGSPSTLPICTNSSSTKRRSVFPRSSSSARVKGTNPQFPAHPSLKISRTRAISSSSFLPRSGRRAIRSP